MPNRKQSGLKGCVHLHMKDGKITNVFSHIDNLPENGIVHLLPEKHYTEEGF